MEPGDVIAFHYRCVHGGPGNLTNGRRRAVALRFVGDDATISTKRPWNVSPPILGGLQHGEHLSKSATFPDLTNTTQNV